MEDDKVCKEVTEEEALIKKIKIILLNNILTSQKGDACCKAVDAYSEFVLTEQTLKVK